LSHSRLDTATLADAVGTLSKVDCDLRTVVRRHGLPPLWDRKPGFATLVQIILEQQVSLASARAVYDRVSSALGTMRHDVVAATGAVGLRRLGVTRQKASYITAAAESVATGTLSFRRVAIATDAAARSELLRVRGVGPWTADVYLLMALCRPDIWPTGDIALLTALSRLKSLHRRPSTDVAAAMAERWRPWRSVAARILWHGYLSGSLR